MTDSCIGSGYCCAKAPCQLGLQLHGPVTPCPSLVFRDDRHWCSELLSAQGDQEKWRKLSALVGGIGSGCCSSLNSARPSSPFYNEGFARELRARLRGAMGNKITRAAIDVAEAMAQWADDEGRCALGCGYQRIAGPPDPPHSDDCPIGRYLKAKNDAEGAGSQNCKPVSSTHVEPGWGCCQCKLYNGDWRTHCKGCGHKRCDAFEGERQR